MIYTKNGSYDLSIAVISFEVTESIFSPFISGSFVISDTESVRILKNTGLREDLSCKIGFSFSGLEDDGSSSQKPITLDPEDYYIYKIDVGEPKGTGTQETRIHFAHKVLFKNEVSTLSKSFQKKKISDMVKDLAKGIQLEWKSIENTLNTFSFVLPYRTPIAQIMFLMPYAVREENSNDVNFVFYQDLEGKHNFVSVGKLYTQSPSFGDGPEGGYLYSLNPGISFASARRCALTHATKTLNAYQNAINGMHSSAVATLDPASKTWAATGYFLPEEWNKQSHMSNKPMIEQDSEFYEIVNGAVSQRYYTKSRHSHCCKEQKNGNNKIGGQNDWLLSRISQIEQMNQTGIEFYTTGNSDISKIGAGKIIYFGRTILNNSVNSSQGPDIAFSGKYLVTSVTHVIRKVKSGKTEYGCNFKCIKDALGDE
jgi:hypothetical protein